LGKAYAPSKKEREFIVRENTPRFLRVFIDQSGNVDILPMTLTKNNHLRVVFYWGKHERDNDTN
jgi:hypothetical protein